MKNGGKWDAPRGSHSLNAGPTKTMVKFILLGECGVGKTSILNRFCDGRFTRNTSATIGVDFKYRDVAMDGNDVRLHVWDTAGQEQFRVVSKPYYRQADGVVLVYDCTNPNSMQELDHYITEARDLCPMGVALAVVGNKADLKSDKGGCISTQEGSTFAKRRGVPLFFEASAANGEGIDNAFEVLCRYAMGNKKANNELRATSVGSGRGPKKAALQPKGDNEPAKKKCGNC